MGQENIVPYTKPQIGLHNIMAVLIIGLYLFGLSLEGFDKSVRGAYVNFHALGGLLVLTLLLVRALLRLVSPPPAFPASMGPGFVRAAHLGHGALYLLMAVVPLLGLATRLSGGRGIDFFVFQLASPMEANENLHHILHAAHGIAANLLALLVLGHIGVAIYHQFVLKDNLLYRLSPKGK